MKTEIEEFGPSRRTVLKTIGATALLGTVPMTAAAFVQPTITASQASACSLDGTRNVTFDYEGSGHVTVSVAGVGSQKMENPEGSDSLSSWQVALDPTNSPYQVSVSSTHRHITISEVTYPSSIEVDSCAVLPQVSYVRGGNNSAGHPTLLFNSNDFDDEESVVVTLRRISPADSHTRTLTLYPGDEDVQMAFPKTRSNDTHGLYKVSVDRGSIVDSQNPIQIP